MIIICNILINLNVLKHIPNRISRLDNIVAVSQMLWYVKNKEWEEVCEEYPYLKQAHIFKKNPNRIPQFNRFNSYSRLYPRTLENLDPNWPNVITTKRNLVSFYSPLTLKTLSYCINFKKHLLVWVMHTKMFVRHNSKLFWNFHKFDSKNFPF